jgi:hypothetical protein
VIEGQGKKQIVQNGGYLTIIMRAVSNQQYRLLQKPNYYNHNSSITQVLTFRLGVNKVKLEKEMLIGLG